LANTNMLILSATVSDVDSNGCLGDERHPAGKSHHHKKVVVGLRITFDS